MTKALTSRWDACFFMGAAPGTFRRARAGCLGVFLAASALQAQRVPHGCADKQPEHWIATWGTAPQRPAPRVQTWQEQSVRLIVHTSAGGNKVRIRISNTFGEQPLAIGGAHIGRRVAGPEIDPASDRTLTFRCQTSVKVPPRSTVTSDPVALEVGPLSDLAISLFFPERTDVTTLHILALQTNYVSPEGGDSVAAVKFPVEKTIKFWPFLTAVEVAASADGATLVALGSSLTDGDGSSGDANRRWPDVLAERLQRSGGKNAEIGVVNAGIIGNRLLSDASSPGQERGRVPLGAVFAQLGAALGQAGLIRFDRDVLAQPSVRYVIIGLGVNDILFPGSFVPATESVTVQRLLSGYRQLIARAHQNGIRAIGTTIPPFEHALWRKPYFDRFFSPDTEKVRAEINSWIRSDGEFDGIIDFDAAVRDPSHPTQLLPRYDSGDHLHVNDEGNIAQANAIALALFRRAEPK